VNANLTKNERITVGLGVTALVISIISPFITYRWFQSAVREQTLKEQGFKASGWHGYSYSRKNVGPDGELKPYEIIYNVDLMNTGALPVGKVVVSFRFRDKGLGNDIKDKIRIEPPMLARIDLSQDTLIISLENALPPRQRTTLSFSVGINESDIKNEITNPDAWVSSESSASIPIVWGCAGVSID